MKKRKLNVGKTLCCILAVATNDPFYKNFESFEELPIHLVDEIEHFFSVYKFLEGKETEIIGISDQDEAERIILESIDNYKENEL